MRGIVVGSGEGEEIRSPLGGRVRFLARGEETGGAASIMDVANGPGDGPPLHVHPGLDEWIYILEGEVRWKLGDEMKRGPTGCSVFIPRGLPHTWQVVGDAPARMLVAFLPAGMEGFFEALSMLTDFDPDAFRRVGAENGMDVVGPPLAESDPL